MEIEVNDNTELRELLSRAIKRLEHIVGCDMHFFEPDATSCDGKISTGECNHKRTCELIFEARKALAKPQRNCDVGTAEEQTHRFDRHCNKYLLDRDEDEECVGCPLVNMAGHCELNWAQMPYEEGGGE